jgi:hypothetical protein
MSAASLEGQKHSDRRTALIMSAGAPTFPELPSVLESHHGRQQAYHHTCNQGQDS